MPRASQGEGDFSGTVCLHGTDGLFEHETSQSWSHPSPTMSHCYCYTADSGHVPFHQVAFCTQQPDSGARWLHRCPSNSLLTTFAACPEHFGHQEWCQAFETEKPSN